MDAPHLRFAALREHHGLSRRAFAERLGLKSAEAVRFIETNERSAGRDLCFAVERLSTEPNAEGVVWPGAPLLAAEWENHRGEPHATQSEPAISSKPTIEDDSIAKAVAAHDAKAVA